MSALAQNVTLTDLRKQIWGVGKLVKPIAEYSIAGSSPASPIAFGQFFYLTQFLTGRTVGWTTVKRVKVEVEVELDAHMRTGWPPCEQCGFDPCRFNCHLAPER